MASFVTTVIRFRSLFFFTSTVKQYVYNTSVRFSSSFSSGRAQNRSSLFEHIKEGYSDKPELDMRRICEHTDQVITELENRKGDLGAVDVRAIVRISLMPCAKPLHNNLWWLFVCSHNVKNQVFYCLLDISVEAATGGAERDKWAGWT